MSSQLSCPPEDTLNRFLEQELEETQNEAFNEHLEQCANCQSRLDALTDSQFDASLTSSRSQDQDPKVSDLVYNLSLMSPSVLENGGSATSSSLRFPEPPNEDAPLGQLGHYRIQEPIGSGASGLLYRATDPRIDREVAIKVLRFELASHEESRKRLNREARAISGLKHDGVVQLFEFGDTPEFPPYLVMEYINGESIEQRLKRSKLIPVKESVDMAIPIARALSAAHEVGLVHRDVKPSNILLDENNHPKVTDFGLALLDDGNTNLTREGTLAGTPAYISPEQIVDPHNVDGRTDTYSLAVMLYHMLTGELPFQGVARMTLLAVLQKEPPAPRQYNDAIPRDLETIVLKAMSKDRDKRYATADDFADDLQRWKDGKPIHARPVGRMERFWGWCKRNPGTAMLSATVAMLLLTVTVGSVVASINLAAARRAAEKATIEAESQRDRAFETLESLVQEVNDKFDSDRTAFGADANHTAARKAMLGISVRGLREITATSRTAGRVNISTATAHIRLAMVLSQRGEYDEAAVHFDKGGEILEGLGGEDSEQLPVIDLIVESAFSRGGHAGERKEMARCKELLSEAVRIAEKAYKRWPDNFDAHLLFARTHVAAASYLALGIAEKNSDMIPAANAAVIEFEKKYPENSRAFLKRTFMLRINAGVARNERKFSQALEHCEQLIERCLAAPKKGFQSNMYTDWLVIGYHDAGGYYLQNGDKTKALECFEKLLLLQKKSKTLYYPLSKIQAIQGGVVGLRFQIKDEQL